VTEPEPGDGQWHLIHSFIDGWGWSKTDEKCETTYVFYYDVCEFFPELKDDLWRRLWADRKTNLERTGEAHQVTQEELDDLFERLAPPLEKRQQERIKWMEEHPFVMPDKIKLPLVRKPYPKLISEILTSGDSLMK
jgi:hypothetical protein